MSGRILDRVPDLDRARFPGGAVTVIVLVLVGAALLLGPDDSFRSVRKALGVPPERVLPAPPAPPASGDFAFAMTQPGSTEPVGWDPCETIRYAVNPAGEPAGGRDLVERALERISAVTGLAFEDVGTTERRPFADQPVTFDDLPVVIGWADDSEVPELAGQVVGLGGGSAPDDGSQDHYYITGGIVLDTDAFTEATIAQSPRVMEALVVHEVAHLVGLGHVNEPMELMFGSNDGQTEFGPGDLTGLARLGSLPCR